MPWMRPEALAKTHLARYASPRGAPRSARQKNKAIQNLRSPQWLTFACVPRTLKRGYYIRGKSEKKRKKEKGWRSNNEENKESKLQKRKEEIMKKV